MKQRWLRRAGATLALVTLFIGCAGPGSGPADDPARGEPRLLLELTAGDGHDQPGHTPGRVGGVAPSGPLALAVEGPTIYLADQAKGRILQYEDGRLARVIPAPWMDEGGLTLT